MAIGISAMLVLTSIAYWLEGIRPYGLLGKLTVLAVALAMIAPVPAYLREKGQSVHAEAVLALMWAVALVVLLPMSVEVAARFCLPLQDARLIRADQALGVNVPEIVNWSSLHWLGRLVTASYPILSWLIPLAIVLPAIAGNARAARGYVKSNLYAFAIGLPLFALLPAVGPWYGYHTAATQGQLGVQNELLALRSPAGVVFELAGVICFPSFHVVWAVLCARSLWAFRIIRIPAAILCLFVGLSTITTGWHYFVDVLAGVVIALVAAKLGE